MVQSVHMGKIKYLIILTIFIVPFVLAEAQYNNVLPSSEHNVYLTYVNGTSSGNASVAGNDGEIQYNDGGSFGASVDLFWDKVKSFLGIKTKSPLYNLDVNGTARIANNLTVNKVVASNTSFGTYYNGTDLILGYVGGLA